MSNRIYIVSYTLASFPLLLLNLNLSGYGDNTCQMLSITVRLICTNPPNPFPIPPSPHFPTPVKTTVPQEVACFNYRWIPFLGAFIPYCLVDSIFPGRGMLVRVSLLTFYPAAQQAECCQASKIRQGWASQGGFAVAILGFSGDL